MLLCGNGLSIDFSRRFRSSLDPSSPLTWPVPHPDAGLLVDALPRFRAWRDKSLASESSHFRAIATFTARSKGTTGPFDWDEFDVHSELRHFLALAYAWYQRQLDKEEIRRWSWHTWIGHYRQSIVGALSLNYDLILERSLFWNRIPIFYPGTDGKPIFLRSALGLGIPIPLSKPHGSANFGSLMRLSPVGYPLPTHTWAGNAPLRVLRDSELPKARDLADIVTPGEWNVFPQYLTWAQMMHRAFRQTLRVSDTIVIVGFSFGEADREEFEMLFSAMSHDHQVIIADPSPSSSLLGYLETRGIKPIVWPGGPSELK